MIFCLNSVFHSHILVKISLGGSTSGVRFNFPGHYPNYSKYRANFAFGRWNIKFFRLPTNLKIPLRFWRIHVSTPKIAALIITGLIFIRVLIANLRALIDENNLPKLQRLRSGYFYESGSCGYSNKTVISSCDRKSLKRFRMKLETSTVWCYCWIDIILMALSDLFALFRVF